MGDIIRSGTRSEVRFSEQARRARGRDPSSAPERIAETVAAIVPRITISIVHQNEIAREGLGLLLSRQPDMAVVASCGGHLGVLRNSQPELVLLALGAQNRDGMRHATYVFAAAPNARVIVIGPPGACADLACLVQAGVFGFVLEDATSDELLRTVRSVASGLHVWPPSIARSLFSQLSRDGARRDESTRGTGPRMTPREREVMALIAAGLRTKEIAKQLSVACFTVRAHVRNIMEKLGMHTRLQIAAHVYREREDQSLAQPQPLSSVGHRPVPLFQS
jgi:NarL family two-component system response regulator LiaR